MEVLVHNQPYLAVTYPASQHITVVSRDKKMTIAYKENPYVPTLMRKLQHFIEDVFTLDKNPVDGKCVIHVLDCCKLPWIRVRSITLETRDVTDFSIIDCSPCNIVISTNSTEKLIQGFNFSSGNLLWNIDGMSCNIAKPCKIAANNRDEIYVTDSDSLKVHLISASGVYGQVVAGVKNHSHERGNILVHRKEFFAGFKENEYQKLDIYKIVECRKIPSIKI